MPRTSAVLEAQSLGYAGQGWDSQGIGTMIMREGEGRSRTNQGLEDAVLSLTCGPSFRKLPKGELIPTSLHGVHGVNRSTMYKLVLSSFLP